MNARELTAKATLLLVDLQKAIDDPSWGTRNNPDAERNIGRLLAAWRRNGFPVAHVRHESREPLSTYRLGQRGVEFKDGLEPLPGERVVTKHVHSAFVGTDLEAWLRPRGATPIVIVGVITNNSVEATARMASDLGFETVVVSDATFTFGRPDHSGVLRTALEVHEMSLANLEGEYAAVLTTDEVLALLGD